MRFLNLLKGEIELRRCDVPHLVAAAVIATAGPVAVIVYVFVAR
jgi:hypothetical protein